MKYYLDTEFLEGTQKKWFGKTKPIIDLISIGIVSEDNREYYAISKDFNLKEAWNRFQMKQVYGDMRNRYPDGVKEYWIRENVLRPIFDELLKRFDAESSKSLRMGIYIGTIVNPDFSYKVMKYLINRYGKTNNQIAIEVERFVDNGQMSKVVSKEGEEIGHVLYYKEHDDFVDDFKNKNEGYTEIKETPVQFYTYYGAYDWVVFCWLFGKMIDLPKGFPMFSIDLKVMLDDCIEKINNYSRSDERMPKVTAKSMKENNPRYPKQENLHNALDDARWNLKLHQFIEGL